MKIIKLSNSDQNTLVDDSDYENLNKYTWHITEKGYVRRSTTKNKKAIHVKMHRDILKLTDKNVITDHINRNKLDNRKCNLRTCTHSESQKNKNGYGISKYLGVDIQKVRYKNKIYEYFRAGIVENGRYKFLGTFKIEEDAARAYDEAAKKYHGEFANPNFSNQFKGG